MTGFGDTMSFRNHDDPPLERVLAAKKGASKKGDRRHLCEAPAGPFRQMGSVPGLSPLLLNVYLHHFLDRRWQDQWSNGAGLSVTVLVASR
jgi:hypothetical protein